MRLSILIPVFNEANSVKTLLERVISQFDYFASRGITPEIILVDDGSTDSSGQQIEAFQDEHAGSPVRVVRDPANRGKGSAVRTAIANATGDYCLIQDADLEYNPDDYPKLLEPLLSRQADVVLGSRRMVQHNRIPLHFWQGLANRVISAATGIASSLELSDVETGYKLFPRWLARTLPLKSNGFGLDPEIVIQLARRHARFVEVPIRYSGRTYAEGKKISPADFCYALAAILRTRFFSAAHTDPASDMLVAISESKRFNRWMADTVRPLIRGDVIEFGAGIGTLTVLLSTTADRYVATDSDPLHLSELSSRVAHHSNVTVGICDFAKKESAVAFRQSADTAICLNVLEHVSDDSAGLQNIRLCLRENGTAIILVPQGPQAFGSLDEVLDHKRRYTRIDLENKMRAAGFRVAQILEFNHASWPGWYLNSRILRRRTLSRLQVRILDLLVPFLKLIDHRLPWPPTSLIAIGVCDR